MHADTHTHMHAHNINTPTRVLTRICTHTHPHTNRHEHPSKNSPVTDVIRAQMWKETKPVYTGLVLVHVQKLPTSVVPVNTSSSKTGQVPPRKVHPRMHTQTHRVTHKHQTHRVTHRHPATQTHRQPATQTRRHTDTQTHDFSSLIRRRKESASYFRFELSAFETSSGDV